MDTTPIPTQPLEILGAITFFSVVIRMVVDAIKRQYPINGTWVNVLAWALGIVIAAAMDIQGTEALLDYVGVRAGRVPITPVDYAITGAAMAAGAGVLADLAGRNKAPVAVVEVNANGERL